MATIRDISKQTGYSISTVSRAINHRGYVSAKTMAEIQQVVKDFDYVPSAIAQDLSAGRSRNVGVVIPHLKHPYFSNLVDSIIAAAFKADYNVVILQSKYDPDLEESYLERLHRKALDAVIFTSHQIAITRMLPYQKYGAVVCCENPNTPKIAAAYALRKATFIEAFQWIKAQGFHRIGILLSRSPKVSATSQVTLNAYQQVFLHQPAAELLNLAVTTYQDGYHAAEKFQQSFVKPDYFFANGDDVAAGIRQYYVDHELPLVPIMGQENQLSGKLLNFPTIDHHFQRVGAQAFKLAQTGEIKQVSVPSQLILR